MLKLSNVSAGYDGVDVVHDISFELAKGENLAMIGPNSCGKTTVLRAIAGVLEYRGDITLDGRPLRDLKRKEIAKRIALMSQIAKVNFPYTVHETVMMGRYRFLRQSLFGKPTRADIEAVDTILQKTNLIPIRDKRIDHLSGGQLQRVFLAHTLVQEPQIILLDEPTNHLDIRYQLDIVQYLKEWASQDDHAVIGVFHDINLAMHLTDQLLFMKEGRIKGIGRADDLVTTRFLKEIYDVDIVGYMHDSYARWKTFKENGHDVSQPL